MNLNNKDLLSFILLYNRQITNLKQKDIIIHLIDEILKDNRITEKILSSVVNDIELDLIKVGSDDEERSKIFNSIVLQLWFSGVEAIYGNGNEFNYFSYNKLLKIIELLSKDDASIAQFVSKFCYDNLFSLNIDMFSFATAEPLLRFINNIQRLSIYASFSMSFIDEIYRYIINIGSDKILNLYDERTQSNLLKKIILDSVYNKLRYFDILNINRLTNSIYDVYSIFPTSNYKICELRYTDDEIYMAGAYNHKLNPVYGLMMLYKYNRNPYNYLMKLPFIYRDIDPSISARFAFLYPFDLEHYLFLKSFKATEVRYRNIFDFIKKEFKIYAKKYKMDINEIVRLYEIRMEKRSILNQNTNNIGNS